tara:strand:+ start:251 stop:1630 length:1380 start_codon:yes stop_codon:yes gene_type:complete
MNKNEHAEELGRANQEVVEYSMVIDLMSNLTRVMSETDAIENILNLFSMLFAPEIIVYVSLLNGKPVKINSRPESLAMTETVNDLVDLPENHAFTKTGKGFIVRVNQENERMGILKIDNLAFPEHKKHYLNLSLAIADVCGLSISNARAYEKIKEMDKKLEKSKNNLNILLEERTKDLKNKTELLMIEINDRKLAEEKLKTAYKELEGTQKASLNIMVDLYNQRKELDASLKEKEVLLREIHHRVKNNMQVMSSLLSLQAHHVKDKKDLELFKESQTRIKSMSLIHEKLYQTKNLANIDFNDYIKSLANDMFSLYNVNINKIGLKINVEDVSFTIDAVVPLGLVINELLSNSLKYAFPGERKGEIRIFMGKISDFGYENKNLKESKSEIRDQQSEIEFIFSDNGVGIPENIDYRNTKSLGLQLVTDLAEGQLGGKIELNRDKGTEFRIRFKELKDKKII